MKDLSKIKYFKPSEKLVDILCKKTQNTNPLFFRVLVAYYFTKVASMMRTGIKTHDRGVIPVSLYAMNLASSGQGKGFSTNIVEEQVINQFRNNFLEDTFPIVSNENLVKLALRRSVKKNVPEEDELARVEKEFEELGNLAFSFDSGTTAAVKQMRHKLLMAKAGSMNMEIDEIGSNLLGNVDVLNTFLELFDVGKVKQKLTKNTKENIRGEEIDGRTPTNMMLFGTPAKLLNGSKVEEEFYAMLETGYARRCLFGYSKQAGRDVNLTAEQIYDMMTDTKAEIYLQELSNKLGNLADINNFHTTLTMTKAVSILLIEYKMQCEAIADSFGDHEEIRKAEMAHRYFKALKLAGTYAFIEGLHEITENILYSSIKLIEESGAAFSQILTRDRNYVKLANYIANIGREVTHVDLVEDLPFYKGAEAQKRDLMTLAIAYGYKNNIIIKRSFNDGIEFLKGESLKETNIDEIIVSYSKDIALSYRKDFIKFDNLHVLTQSPDHNFINHVVIDGHRKDVNIIPGFNMAVIDVDGGTAISTVKLLLKDFTYHIYTTKRHTDIENRFRIIFPLSHILKLTSTDYKHFMENIYEWLPFDVDTGTKDRCRKWLTHKGEFWYNKGTNLDALLFIPETKKSDERKAIINDQQALSNMQRWFINNTNTGNRSNQLIRYALMLVDSGLDITSIQNNVLDLNSKLPDKLEEIEILSTIMQSVNKAITKRNSP